MVRALCPSTAAVPPPADQRALAKQPTSLHCTALVVVTRLSLGVYAQTAENSVTLTDHLGVPWRGRCRPVHG